jgi:ubiquinol-cytochrome c reductase subunit 6
MPVVTQSITCMSPIDVRLDAPKRPGNAGLRGPVTIAHHLRLTGPLPSTALDCPRLPSTALDCPSHPQVDAGITKMADEEIVNPIPEIEEACRPQCVKALLAYEQCAARIADDQGGEDNPHCTGQYFDMLEVMLTYNSATRPSPNRAHEFRPPPLSRSVLIVV